MSKSDIKEGNIVSKKGLQPYTNITRDESLKKSMDMYKDNSSVISSLVNSYAWDTTIEYISKRVDQYKFKIDNEERIDKVNKTGEGNDILCEIYDLSGNVSEWTTEYSNNGYYTYTSPCVPRGESYQSNYLNATTRLYNGEDVKNDFIGFRTILYLK